MLPVILVSIGIPSRFEDEFNDFYHHEYIPDLLQAIPEIKNARRYQEFNTEGSLRYYKKVYWSIYELASSEVIDYVDVALKKRREQSALVKKFHSFQAQMTHCDAATMYTCRYQHPRKPLDGPFGSRPFFSVSVEVRPDRLDAFNDWYERVYLSRNLADVPTWIGCRRYSSIQREKPRQMTIYEAQDKNSLIDSLELMRAKFRLKDNESWQNWDSGNDPAITWEDATSFMPFFRYPD